MDAFAAELVGELRTVPAIPSVQKNQPTLNGMGEYA
jgi:hypothetical protein